jgi:hypothetical protein
MEKIIKLGLLFFFGIVSFLLMDKSYAQEKTSNNNIWFHYFGKNMMAEKFSFSFEATMRYANGLSEKQQYFVRPSFDYQFTNRFMGSVGYSHYVTYPYGDPSIVKIPTPEDHVWIQGTYVHNYKQLKISHRLRDEFRFMGIAGTNSSGDIEIVDYVYRNRLRYMFMLNYPLTKQNDTAKLFALFGDEVFMNLGTDAGATFLNQNRLIGGLGYNVNKNHQFQLSFIHQYIWNYSNTLQESNPTIRLTYVTNFDWRK